LGVGKSTVEKWARQLRKERNEDAVKATSITEERRRIRELERENKHLKIEKETLSLTVCCER